MSEMISFKSFLSHRYKSAQVNLYFFKIFDQVAEVQFEIDRGDYKINVTKLEKMVRNADAFIGIYPFPGLLGESFNAEELKKQSQYFRLEIDLAIRSQKPAIIFYDKRYGNLIKPPSSIFAHTFDMDEITGSGGYPSHEKHKRMFTNFCESVSRKMRYEETQIDEEKNTAAIFLSSTKNSQTSIKDFVNDIKELLAGYNYSDIEVVTVPVSLDNKFFRTLEKIDLAIVDYGGDVATSGIPAFLHGRFIPIIRMKQQDQSLKENSELLETFLFGGTEVGYVEDIINWIDGETLKKELSIKLEIILKTEKKRINTYEEAKKYFEKAVLRKERVFVSYSGEDKDLAKPIISELKKYFQDVFDYSDMGSSINPGQPWVVEIFDKLSQSAIGISLLSESYFKSGNCMHEAQQMIAYVDSKKLIFFPIKLHEPPLKLPPFLQIRQYLDRIHYSNTEELVTTIVNLI